MKIPFNYYQIIIFSILFPVYYQIGREGREGVGASKNAPFISLSKVSRRRVINLGTISNTNSGLESGATSVINYKRLEASSSP